MTDLTGFLGAAYPWVRAAHVTFVIFWIAGLFIEAHPEPAKALCDGPSALELAGLRDLLLQAKKVDEAVKPASSADREA